VSKLKIIYRVFTQHVLPHIFQLHNDAIENVIMYAIQLLFVMNNINTKFLL